MPIEEKLVGHSPYYVTREKTFTEKAYVNRSADRAEELYNQTVKVGSFTYDAGERSMDRIDRVLTLANAKMNAAMAQGLSLNNAYQMVYVDTPVPWKLADNTIEIVNAETLMEVQDAAMEGMKALWLKYG